MSVTAFNLRRRLAAQTAQESAKQAEPVAVDAEQIEAKPKRTRRKEG